jgi:CRP-like cAMP-binding protein
MPLSKKERRSVHGAREKLRNKILARLPPADFALLKPGLTLVDLPLRKLLEVRGRRIEHVYFPESGLASVVVTGAGHHSLEVGMIGREGMTGLSVILMAERSPNETFMQSAGEGWRIGAEELLAAMDKSPSLRTVFMRHGHSVMTQMAFTALSNGSYKIDERLARWLLMAQDRSDGPVVYLTHEFLSVMLGVRRPGVTAALGDLERLGLISAQRGSVTVLNRAGLEDAANGGYGGPEAEYERLFGA